MKALLDKIKPKKGGDCMCELTGFMNWSRTQTHIWHLQTDNEALHEVLNTYYDSIVGFMDELSEVYLGHYPEKKSNYKFEDIDNSLEVLENDPEEQVRAHISQITKLVDKARVDYKSKSSIVNILDDVNTFLNKTLYMITLK